MSESNTDDLRRRAESGVPRGAATVWEDAVGAVQRRRRRLQVAAAAVGVVAFVAGLSLVVGGADGDDVEVVSTSTTVAAGTDEDDTAPAVGETTVTPSSVPDLLLDAPDEAIAELQSAGLLPEVVVGPFGEGDVVLATDPQAGATIEPTQTVSLVVGPVPLVQTPFRAELDDLLLWQNGGGAYQRIELRKSEMVAACMAERELTHEVWTDPPPEDPLGVIELARNGWSLVRRLTDGPPGVIRWGNPNAEFMDTLGEVEKKAYGEAWDECRLAAEDWQSPYNLEQQDLLAAVFADLGADFALIDDDPAVVAGLQAHLDCVGSAHDAEVDALGLEFAIVTERLERFTDTHGDDPEAWSAAARDELAEVERFEHEVAFTTVACVIEHYRPVRDAVAVRVEETMLVTYAAFLADLQDVVDRALG